MKVHRLIPCALALTVLAASASLAQSPASPAAPASPASPAPPSGFRGEFLAQQDNVEKEILGLAEATPADKYGWRPAPGVRSVSEVFIHIVGGNYLFGGYTGMKPPTPMDMPSMAAMEKNVTEKAKVIEELKKSFVYLRAGVAALPDADLDKPVKFFGRDFTVRGVLLIGANHEHEHLGQSIAYARMNGITPPWAAEQARQMKEMMEKMEKKPAPAPAAK
ncbi:MAG: DinB family protein [Acidobacteriota bacterium]